MYDIHIPFADFFKKLQNVGLQTLQLRGKQIGGVCHWGKMGTGIFLGKWDLGDWEWESQTKNRSKTGKWARKSGFGQNFGPPPLPF